MVGEFFLSLFLQLLFTVGAVTLFGLLTHFVNMAFYKTVGGGRAICYATGVIGTPIHEGSHALMCLLFGHRITEIKLFQIDEESGVLGYVRHTYNPRSIYSRAGNFFIGVAPVLLGNAVILLLLFIMARPAFDGVISAVSDGISADGAAFAAGIFTAIGKSFVAIFSPLNFANGWYWLFLPLAFCISLHVDLSPADVKCGVLGGVILAGIFAALDLVCAIVQSYSGIPALSAVTGGVLKVGVTMTCIMTLSLFFSLVLLAIAAIARLIVRLIRGKKAANHNENEDGE